MQSDTRNTHDLWGMFYLRNSNSHIRCWMSPSMKTSHIFHCLFTFTYLSRQIPYVAMRTKMFDYSFNHVFIQYLHLLKFFIKYVMHVSGMRKIQNNALKRRNGICAQKILLLATILAHYLTHRTKNQNKCIYQIFASYKGISFGVPHT